MREVHALVSEWMQHAGMTVEIDAAGNLRGVYSADRTAGSRRLVIGSHLDTVPRAGAFDGILGVIMAVAVAAAGFVVIPALYGDEFQSASWPG